MLSRWWLPFINSTTIQELLCCVGDTQEEGIFALVHTRGHVWDGGKPLLWIMSSWSSPYYTEAELWLHQALIENVLPYLVTERERIDEIYTLLMKFTESGAPYPLMPSANDHDVEMGRDSVILIPSAVIAASWYWYWMSSTSSQKERSDWDEPCQYFERLYRRVLWHRSP